MSRIYHLDIPIHKVTHQQGKNGMEAIHNVEEVQEENNHDGDTGGDGDELYPAKALCSPEGCPNDSTDEGDQAQDLYQIIVTT